MHFAILKVIYFFLARWTFSVSVLLLSDSICNFHDSMSHFFGEL